MSLKAVMACACCCLGAVACLCGYLAIRSVYLVAHIKGDTNTISSMNRLLVILFLCIAIAISWWRATPAHER